MIDRLSNSEQRRSSAIQVVVTDPKSRIAQACIDCYMHELTVRFEDGFQPNEGPSAEPHELVHPRGVFLVGMLEGRPVACGALKNLAPGVGEIKRMWVAPQARGLGIAKRILSELERHASELGFNTIRLDTNKALSEAAAMYKKFGYVEIERYNDNPYAHMWFQKILR